MSAELKRNVAVLCDLIDQYASAKDSGSSLALFLGTSIGDVQEKAREVRNQMIFGDRRTVEAQAADPRMVDCPTCEGSGRISSVELCQRCNESGILPAQAADVGELPPLPEELTPILLLNAALCIEGDQIAQHKKDSIVEKLGRCAEALQERRAALKGNKP